QGWPDRLARDRAYDRLLHAVMEDDWEAALRAGEQFRAAGADGRVAQVEELCAQAREVPRRRTRDAAYEKMLAASALPGAEPTVVEAAGEFRQALPSKGADQRTEQVERLCREAVDAPRRRLREAAYQNLRAALAQGDERTVLAAASCFLQAQPADRKD